MQADYYLALAMKSGATHAVTFKLKDIVFDARTILKCMFGCKDWGRGPTCPSRPGSLLPWEYKPILSAYKWGIIIHSTVKKTAQEISFAIEREAFLKGCYFAFSMSDCALCQECAGNAGQPCVNPKMARPALHSVGIDVFKTVRKFGLPLATLKDHDQPQNWYAAVFIE